MSEREQFDQDVAKIGEALLYVGSAHESVVRDAQSALRRLTKLGRNTFEWADAIDANWQCGGNDWWTTLMEIRSYRAEADRGGERSC